MRRPVMIVPFEAALIQHRETPFWILSLGLTHSACFWYSRNASPAGTMALLQCRRQTGVGISLFQMRTILGYCLRTYVGRWKLIQHAIHMVFSGHPPAMANADWPLGVTEPAPNDPTQDTSNSAIVGIKIWKLHVYK